VAPDISNTVTPGCHVRAEAQAHDQSEKEADAVWSAMYKVVVSVAPDLVMTTA